MWRRGNIPFHELSSLVPNQTWKIVENLDKLRATRNGLREELLTGLYNLVPSVTPTERRALIALQRDVYNHRKSGTAILDTVKQLLNPEQCQVLLNWLATWQYEVHLLAEARETLSHELPTVRQKLAQLVADEDFMRGIQFSGAVLYQNVEAFIDSIRTSGNIPRRLKKTEVTLISFLYRAALKPSPFASFTEVGVLHQASPSTLNAVLHDNNKQVRMVHLSRNLLLVLERLLDQIEECREHFPLHLNNTVLHKGDKIEFFTRGLDGTPDAFGKERFVNLPLNGFIRLILKALKEGVCSRASLAEQLLLQSGVTETEARAFIERLVKIGLIERGSGLPDHEKRYARRIAEVLALIPGEKVRFCAEIFSKLADIEEEFSVALAKKRGYLWDQIQSQVDSFFDTVSTKVPAMDNVKSRIYEDVGTLEKPGSWDPALLETAKDDFVLLQQLLPLFNGAIIERLGLYEYFSTLYGPEGTCDDILDFYKNFAQLDGRTVSSLMLGAHNPYVSRIRELRKTLFDSMKSLLRESESSFVLLLDKAWIQDFVRQFPEFLEPCESVAYRLQFLGGPEDERGLVFNGVATGYESSCSRFCDLFESANQEAFSSLREAVKSAINRRSCNIEQVDMTAVLGLNINLHPSLTRLEIEYPGSRAFPEPERVLSLRDLRLCADAQRKRLRLFSKRNERYLNLVPLNFLFPTVGPQLYRFLCVLSPYMNFHGGFWERYIAYVGESELDRSSFPRLQLGNIILERRTWKHEIDKITHIDINVQDELSLLIAASRWQEEMGFPREGFFRINDSGSSNAGSIDWKNEMKNWALSARKARLRKPHYIDFKNPFLLKILFKQLGTVSGGFFTLQECLPATDLYMMSRGPASAEEFVIELNYEGAEE